ncbi:MAG: hypothetical protein RLZZ127_1460 [Planctomycetota bacterium]|jgi:paraquat-inducible protein A
MMENLGKWSMLDALLVAILLGLTVGQWLVEADPRAGIPLFVTGIALGMAVSAILAAVWHRPATTAPVEAPPPAGRGRTRLCWLLVVVCAVALAGAQALPMLRIESVWLRDGAFSIVGLVEAVAREGSWALAALLVLGCIVVPWCRLLALAWLVARRGRGGGSGAFRALGPWSLIDVFAVALAVFLLEGSAFVPAELGPGAVLLAAALLIHAAARIAVARLAAASART